MANVRKKARKKPAEGPNVEPSKADAQPAGARPDVIQAEHPRPSTASEHRPRKRQERKISLPPSGLASDILARAEAADIESVPFAAEEEVVSLPVPTEPSHAQNISFFATPSREEKKPVEPMEHLVTFFLGDEEYGLDVRLVQEIIRVAETTPVPRAPEHVKGVINLRGRIIPVVDLKLKLKLGEVDTGARGARIVVTKQRERLIGLLVDGASQVLKIPVSVVDTAPEEVLEADAEYIRGVAKLEDRLIILMDLNRVLTMEPHTPATIGMD